VERPGNFRSGSGAAALAIAAELQQPGTALVVVQPTVLVDDSAGTGEEFATASEGSGSVKERSPSPRLPLKQARSPARVPLSGQKSPARKSSSTSPAPAPVPDSEVLSGSEDDSTKKEKRIQKRKRNVAIAVGQQGKMRSSSKESEA